MSYLDSRNGPNQRKVSHILNAHALNLMQMLSGFQGLRFNPLHLIKTVNYFHKMGFDQSLQALREYCMLAREQASKNNPENALMVARVLYEHREKKGGVPQLILGQPDLNTPEDNMLFPQFPIVIYRGIPFLLISGYIAAGQGMPPLEYIEWCQRYGKLRSGHLLPDDNPLASVDEFLLSSSWQTLEPKERHYFMLRLQALRAVSKVYHLREQDETEMLSPDAIRWWRKHRKAFDLLNVSWNDSTNDYEIESDTK